MENFDCGEMHLNWHLMIHISVRLISDARKESDSLGKIVCYQHYWNEWDATVVPPWNWMNVEDLVLELEKQGDDPNVLSLSVGDRSP